MFLLTANDPYGFHFVEGWVAAFSSGNVDSLVGLYQAEAVLVPDSADFPCKGQEAIRAYWEGFFAQNPGVKAQILPGEVNQNLGQDRCMTGRIQYSSNATQVRYTFVVEAVAGVWLIKAQHTSFAPAL